MMARYRSVVMLKSINYDLMSPGEREAVEGGYQGFLNSLYFPIQIFVRSRRVDLTPYLDKLDKIRNEHDNMLLAMLMDDYMVFMTELAEDTNVMDKMFYIVIPFFVEATGQAVVKASKSFLTGVFGQKEQAVTINEVDLENAKQELRNRVQSVLNGLQQCGVQGLPLDTQELIELYYDFYNPDTATRQQLKHFDDLTAPIVTKGDRHASQPDLRYAHGEPIMFGIGKKQAVDPVAYAEQQRLAEEQVVQAAFQKGVTALRDFIAPSSIEYQDSHFQIGTRFARTYYVYGYPRQIYTGWLSGLINIDETVDISIYVYPVDSQGGVG